MDNDIPWNLIVEKLSGTISAERLAILNKWLAQPDNKEIYREVELLWRGVRHKSTRFEPDRERGWKMLSSRMDAIEKKRKPRVSIPHRRVAAIGIAASLLLAASLALILPGIDAKRETVISVYHNKSNDGRSYMSLPDGSSVWLRPGSSLRYSETRKNRRRHAELKGEAFFDIAHDARRMFTVSSGGIMVKVHGTKFNVDSNPLKQDIRVILVEGSVSLSADRKELLLSPGESASYNKLEGTWRLEKTDSELAAVWAAGRLHFENKSLGYICKYLEVWYGIEIDLDPALAEGQAYNFTVTDQSKEEIMAMLARVTGFDYVFDPSGKLYIRQRI